MFFVVSLDWNDSQLLVVRSDNVFYDDALHISGLNLDVSSIQMVTHILHNHRMCLASVRHQFLVKA